MNRRPALNVAWGLALALSWIALANRTWAEVAPPIERPPLAVRWWGQAFVTIETWWGPTVAIDPYSPRIGYEDPNVEADLVLITHEHFDHNNAALLKGDPVVRRGLDSEKNVAPIDITLARPVGDAEPVLRDADRNADAADQAPHAIHVRSIASFHDDQRGEKRGANSMILIEVDGVRILHCGDLGQTSLTDEQVAQVRGVDVALIPVGGVYTIDGEQAAKIVEQIDPRVVVPIHYKTPALEIPLDDAQPFLSSLPERYERIEMAGNTLAASAQAQGETAAPQAVVLRDQPWTPPAPLVEAFDAIAEQREAFAKTIGGMSIEQLNHRPSDGSHTIRWNVEHLAGRELLFFSQVYHAIDPMIPVIDINPAQQPEDYEPAHPDWPASEEVRLLERVDWFVRRFAYMLDGVAMDAQRIEAPRGSIRGLTDLMLNHYPHHHQAVRDKLQLPDWPQVKANDAR